ncbi:MAG: hypothetical protein MJZ69_09615 [Bacteroidaceae bacterium]|nr:hypothetical protein [Candidatus Minthousia equi]MCQ2247022.1 hypothetical protein [Bacteroidaceae bacterium]MDO4956294.1 hypothetical protein [Bacteroidales bacterium]
MGFFSNNKPRGFHHEYIYYDERKEKLKKIEEKAKRELGLLPPKPLDKEQLHQAFVNSTKHLKRREERGGDAISYKWLVVLIAAGIFILHYLYTNKWSF